jgi:two-component system nitrogen regulation response regulator NtrX
MAPKDFTAAAVRKLEGMEWSGNVRELRNTVERLVIMTSGTTIDAVDIEEPGGSHRRPDEDLLSVGGTFQEFKDRAEAAFIQRMLEEHGWNISKTAEALSIQRSHLYNKMRKYNLTRGADAADRS